MISDTISIRWCSSESSLLCTIFMVSLSISTASMDVSGSSR